MAQKIKQLSFERVNGWGGKRRGSGRPNLSGTVNHMKRPKIRLSEPMHITIKLIDGLPSLRDENVFEDFKATIKNAKHFGLHVLHFALEHNHIHMIVEAKSLHDLANGMRSLGGTLGRIIRKLADLSARSRKLRRENRSFHRNKDIPSGPATRRGRRPVFKGRYHMRPLRTPSEMRNALKYVLLNHSKHTKLVAHIDFFSSGAYFTKWKELVGRREGIMVLEQIEEYREKNSQALTSQVLSQPHSWLARNGWLKAPA
jgi:REP element-mobilizing transposase RayT